MRIAMFVLITAIPSAAVAQTYYVDIYNTAPSGLVALAAAPAGSGTYRRITLGDRPVQGGGDSVTTVFHKADGGCRRDLRFVFADGRVLLQRDFDICKYVTYHTGRYWRFASGRNVAEER